MHFGTVFCQDIRLDEVVLSAGNDPIEYLVRMPVHGAGRCFSGSQPPAGLDKVAPYQNITFKPNCIARGLKQ